MTHRSSFRFAFGLVACAAVLASARPLAAQVVISSSGKGAFATAGSLPISDSAIRSLIETHFPEALTSDSNAPQAVLLVIDANNEFVSGKAHTATLANVVSVGGGMRTFVIGDSLAAAGAVMVGPASVVIRRDTIAGGAIAVAGGSGGETLFSVMRSRMADGEAGGVMGSDYRISDISSINLKRFTAGQLGTSIVIVAVLKLK